MIRILQPYQHVFFALSLLLCLHCVTTCHAQNQGNMWYFARQLALDFNQTPPVFVSDCQIDVFMAGTEGTSSIASRDGKLLFYANGENIWNRKQQLMKNGAGLMGHHSSTNGAVIVPMPGENNKYYVFTTDAFQENLTNGLRYSVVDMCGDNGYGEVVDGLKNTLLLEGAGEKLAFTKHPGGDGYWLVGHKHLSRLFYAYHVSENGISAPVITDIGTFHGRDGYVDAIGQMKISTDGTRLALVIENRSPDVVDLFDFDNTTGKLSNYKDLTAEPSAGGNYGVAFSPDGSKLYIGGRDGIFQFQLDAGNAAAIVASKFLVAPRELAMGGLQLGPDEKIYTTWYDYVGIINKPNLANANCDFNKTGVFLQGGISLYALPTFLDTFDYPDKGTLPLEVPPITDAHVICIEEVISIDVTSTGENVEYQWSDGPTTPIRDISIPGDYIITIQDRFCKVEETIHVTTPAFTGLGPDVVACNGDTMILTALNSGATYKWQHGSTSEMINVYEEGIYWVDITKDNCTFRDSIHVELKDLPVFSLGSDAVLCKDETLQLSINITADSYQWQDGSTNQTYTVTSAGVYSAIAVLNGCNFSDKIRIDDANLTPINLGSDTILCSGDVYKLQAGTDNSSILWSDGSSDNTLVVSENGLYWVKVYNGSCVVYDSIYLEFITCDLVMPNVFTPNDDSFNPKFVPMEMSGIQSARLIIYDRWGLEVFRTDDLVQGWDGHGTNSDVYFWRVQYTMINNTTRVLKGMVTLNR